MSRAKDKTGAIECLDRVVRIAASGDPCGRAAHRCERRRRDEPGSGCIDEALDTYIVTLQAPTDGTVCEQDDAVAATPTAAPPATPTPRAGSISAPDTGDGSASDHRSDAPWVIAVATALSGGDLVGGGRRLLTRHT
jgi:hypothetical protein